MRVKTLVLIFVVALCAVLGGCSQPQDSLSSSPLNTSLSSSQDQTSSQQIDIEPPPTVADSSAPVNPFTGLATDVDLSTVYPTAIMINNVKQSLPQSGISGADLVYEIVTEGGISRLMAVYLDGYSLSKVGPVRSARDQHIQLMLPYVPLFMHIGSSIYATDMLELYKYDLRDIDGMYTNSAVFFDEERAAVLSLERNDVDEHCWFTDGDSISATVDNLGLTPYPAVYEPIFDFLPQTEQKIPTEKAGSVEISFSDYGQTTFEYDDELQLYYKSMYGEPQIDANDGVQLNFKNVIVLFTDIATYPDEMLAKVSYNFGGVGYYFTNGGCEEIHWRKGSPEQPLRIVSTDGTETPIELNAGKSYIAVVGLDQYSKFNYF